MSDSPKNMSLRSQVLKIKPPNGDAFCLIRSGTDLRIPADPERELSLEPFETPRGLREGVYHVEFYDEERKVIEMEPEISNITISYGGPGQPLANAQPDRPAKSVNRTVLYRQHVELRELLMDDVQHLVKVREVFRRECNETLRELLDQHKELMDERQKLNEREKEMNSQQRHLIEGAAEGKPKADYTQLGIGLMNMIQGVTTVIAGGSSRKKHRKRGEMMDAIVGEAAKMADPAQRERILSDPAEAGQWADRMAELSGKKRPGKTIGPANRSSDPKETVDQPAASPAKESETPASSGEAVATPSKPPASEGAK